MLTAFIGQTMLPASRISQHVYLDTFLGYIDTTVTYPGVLCIAPQRWSLVTHHIEGLGCTAIIRPSTLTGSTVTPVHVVRGDALPDTIAHMDGLSTEHSAASVDTFPRRAVFPSPRVGFAKCDAGRVPLLSNTLLFVRLPSRDQTIYGWILPYGTIQSCVHVPIIQ